MPAMVSRRRRALLNGPFDIELDAHGNFYFLATFNHCVRRVDAPGVVTTCAGCGEADYSGDGGAAGHASFNEPCGIAVDKCRDIYSKVILPNKPYQNIMVS